MVGRLSENCTKEFYTIDLRLYDRNYHHRHNHHHHQQQQHFLFSCHRPVLPGTSPETTAIPTAQAASFTRHYFPYNVCCSKCSSFCSESIECFPIIVSKTLL